MGQVKSELREHTLLDRKYALGRVIGQGGMGVVYEATHTTIGRRVAIKCLHRRYSENPRVVRRFEQEARLAGTIGHDNICEVTDFGVAEDGTPYLVMPLLSGFSLEALLKGRGLRLDRLTDIVCQTLSALGAAHRADIVHRDLKPDNIFVTRFGDRSNFVKLLDFGISKVLNQASVLSMTKTGDIIGTPHYMSPEQASGMIHIDHRTDLYAVGAILYEGLTGRCPYEGETYNEIIVKIVNEPFRMPRSITPNIPAAVEAVVLRAMARDPVARYESAEEMASALLRAADTPTSDEAIRPPVPAITVVSAHAPFDPGSSAPPTAARAPAKANRSVALLLSIAAIVAAIAIVALYKWVTAANGPAPPTQVLPISPHPRSGPHTASPLPVSPKPLPTVSEMRDEVNDTPVPTPTPGGTKLKPERSHSPHTARSERPASGIPKEAASDETPPQKGLTKRGINFENQYE